MCWTSLNNMQLSIVNSRNTQAEIDVAAFVVAANAFVRNQTSYLSKNLSLFKIVSTLKTESNKSLKKLLQKLTTQKYKHSPEKGLEQWFLTELRIKF